MLGVLDWDLAQPHDPAVDAAALAWHGWDKVAAAVERTRSTAPGFTTSPQAYSRSPSQSSTINRSR
ncbi:hypothetical protein GXW83_23610 [Streptacidiphilus sp. PB12-B1b]|nr:hypothetical protein GXW83_23610 [Streptacidiphilus sp. PB12-B1b]